MTACARLQVLLSFILFPLNSCVETKSNESEFVTNDPLQAFVHQLYPLGSDYFIHGSSDTVIFRCSLQKARHGLSGLALSEISIWGQKTGPWEVFVNIKDTAHVYIGTRYLNDTACLEYCWTKEYFKTGKCTWRAGWPIGKN